MWLRPIYNGHRTGNGKNLIMDSYSEEKHMDEKELQNLVKGIPAAMYAVAEGLQKQEDRALAQDAEIALQKQAAALELEKAQNATATQDLVKSITEAVVANISKQTTIYGEKENMELNGDVARDETHKDVFYKEGGDEDKQVKAKDTNDTSTVQQTIHAGGSTSLQLMIQKSIDEAVLKIEKHFLKEHEAQYSGNGEDAVEEAVMEEPVEEEMGMDAVEPEGSAEYPMEEEEYEEDTFKMIKSLQKQLETSLAAIPEMVVAKAQEISDQQLLKQGFRKEQSRVPQVTSLAMGLDADDYAIQKSQGETTEDFDINKVSFGDLYTAKMKRDAEGTDGLPQNLFRA